MNFMFYLSLSLLLLVGGRIAWKSRIKYNLLFLFNYVSFISVLMGIGCMLMFIVGLISPKAPRNPGIAVKIINFCHRFLGFEVEVQGRENIPKDDSFIAISNHQSLFDVYLLSSVWPDRCVPLAKRSILYLTGIFGITMWLNGAVFINRQNRKSSIQTCNTCVKIIKQRKLRILLFPEGTRNMSGSHLLPFKKGAFHIAKQVGDTTKIMPVVVSSLQPIIDTKRLLFIPGKVIVSVLEPIETEDKTVDELAQLSYNLMDAKYQQLNSSLKEASQITANKTS